MSEWNATSGCSPSESRSLAPALDVGWDSVPTASVSNDKSKMTGPREAIPTKKVGSQSSRRRIRGSVSLERLTYGVTRRNSREYRYTSPHFLRRNQSTPRIALKIRSTSQASGFVRPNTSDFTWPIASLIYLMVTRRWRGLGWWCLHAAGLFGTPFLTFCSTSLLLYWRRTRLVAIYFEELWVRGTFYSYTYVRPNVRPVGFPFRKS